MVVYRFAFITDFLGLCVTQWSATRFLVACASPQKKITTTADCSYFKDGGFTAVKRDAKL